MTSTAESKHVFKNPKLQTKIDERPMQSLLLIDLA